MAKNWYIDKYVLCPFYSREETSVTRKIHCEGYREGTHLHLCFDTKDLKKYHKKVYCKNTAYRRCPLYKAISWYLKEDNKDEQIL